MAEPRPSTDEESAPLLDRDRRDPDSLFSALMHPTRPLSNLEKVLAAGSIILLLLMSTFIGLFAGAEVQLKKERAGKGHGGTGTVTTTWTETATATSTKVATTTVGSVPTGKPEAPICLSANCIRVAADILDSLNTTADPCHDFYEFAVGGWVDSNEIPADRGIYSSFNVVADRNKKILLKVINSIDGTKTPNSAEESNQRKIKEVYESCMDLGQLDEVGIKPLVPLADFLIDTFGPFDLNPAPDAEFQSAEAEWRGSWDDAYEVPQELIARSERLEELRVAAKTAGRVWERPSMERTGLLAHDVDVEVLKPDTERRDRITKTLAWLHSRGVEGLINFEIEGDAGGEDSQVQSLWLYQSFGGLPSKEYYEEAPILDLYQSVVAGMLTDIASNTHASSKHPKRDVFDDFLQELVEVEAEGWPWPWPGDDKGGDGGDDDGGKQPDAPGSKDEPLDKRMEKLAGKVVRFERELMRAGADPEYLFNPHFAYNPYPVQKVYKALPFLDIPAYLSTFAPRTYPENITVTHPPYLKAVSQIVEDTPDYVLSGYFVTRLAMTYAGALGQKTGVWKEARRLKEVLQGIKKGTEENRQDTCLNWLDGIVGYIVGREFVHEAFSAEAKKEGEDIINSIVKAFHDKLPHISWMDAESAKAAQKKAEAIIPKVGYPLTPDTTNPGALQFWYRMLEIKGDDFFGNVLRSTLVEEARTWQTLGRKRDRQTWEMYPQTVNAYYSPPDGEIVFPAGILQPPFYDFSWPAHLKYGSFGAVAAHELTHAFDNSGSQYDEKGRLRDWWTNETVAAFEERAQCVAKQYSKYYVVGPDGKKEHINGNLTNGEDIADSGLAQAFSAWKSSLSSNDAPIRLPGLEHYTPEQLFFISFGRTWETLIRPQTAVVRIRTDPHSPGYWRAVGTLRNLPAFHQAFDCPVGSKMNPPKEEQCQLW